MRIRLLLPALLGVLSSCDREKPRTPELAPPSVDFPRRVPADLPTPSWASDTERPRSRTEEERLQTPFSPAQQWAVSVEQRRNQVDAPPPGWKPREKGRKVKLTLRLKNDRIRAGQKPAYRAELQNIGDETIIFLQSGSFWRSSHAIDPGTKFRVHGPDGAIVRKRYWPECPHEQPRVIELPGWDKMTSEERAEAVRKHIADRNPYDAKRMALLMGDINIKLLPGETLFTTGWRSLDNPLERCTKDIDELALWLNSGEYRVIDEYPFDKPGTYRIKVVWSDPASKSSSEEDIAFMVAKGVSRARVLEMDRELNASRFGTIESNEVMLAVLP